MKLPVGAAAALLLFAPRVAWASGATWAVDFVGGSCQDQRPALEREISLACGAVGSTCKVAAEPKDAELRAIVDCTNESAWSLETRTSTGTLIERIELAGPSDDRLREAAVEVARDAAPERALAVDALRTALPNEAPAAPVTTPHHLALAVGVRATEGSIGGSTSGGAHLLGAFSLGHITHATLGVAADAGGSGQHSVAGVRGGVGIAIGAPFDDANVFGAAFEVGASTLERSESVGVASDGGASLGSHWYPAGYAQAAVMVQWPRDGIRPYASVVGALTTDGDARFIGSAEAGLAFPIF